MNTYPTYRIESSIQNLCEELDTFYGHRIKFYGEAVESLQENSAGNYISLENEFCSVDDAYDLVAFLVRENATTNPQPAGGRKNVLTRTVNLTLAVNAKSNREEFVISTIVNALSHATYNGTNFDNKQVASQYFGLPERDFETFFFTINVEAVEKITCQPC
jgi:hypothetical protein